MQTFAKPQGAKIPESNPKPSQTAEVGRGAKKCPEGDSKEEKQTQEGRFQLHPGNEPKDVLE